MNSEIGSDALFEQQASVLLQQFQKRSTQLPHRSYGYKAPVASIIDDVAGRVDSLEERLSACDSIYRLAAQTNATQEKERREQFQSTMQRARELDRRLAAAEQKVAQIPQIIRDAVTEQMKSCDNSQRITAMLEEASARIGQRIADLERKLVESSKATKKALKKLGIESKLAQSQPEDDTRIDGIGQQIAELKRRQNIMLEVMNTARTHNQQDFDEVSSQLSGLWTQLSVKRSESPLRHSRNGDA